MTLRILIGLLCAIVLWPGGLFAMDTGDTQPQGPVTITADSMEADEGAGLLVFLGNAVASQDDVTLHADRLTVYYSAEAKEIEKVVATGGVRIVQQERVATGAQAVYDRVADRIVLTGRPMVKEGGQTIEGDEIVLDLKARRSIVTGGETGRVNAVFTPGRKESP